MIKIDNKNERNNIYKVLLSNLIKNFAKKIVYKKAMTQKEKV